MVVCPIDEVQAKLTADEISKIYIVQAAIDDPRPLKAAAEEVTKLINRHVDYLIV